MLSGQLVVLRMGRLFRLEGDIFRHTPLLNSTLLLLFVKLVRVFVKDLSPSMTRLLVLSPLQSAVCELSCLVEGLVGVHCFETLQWKHRNLNITSCDT